jgi:hypothetical protein
MIRITFDVDDLCLGVLGPVVQAVHDKTATDRAVGTGIAGLGGARELEGPHFGKHRRGRISHHGETRSPQTGAADLEELATRDLHGLLLLWLGRKTFY